ncbi:MAG: helix-turn-helix domain-containing protein [Thiobacillus sp.]
MPKANKAGVNEYQPYEVDVANLRKRLGLAQEQFAARFGFSVATLRHWERGDPIGAQIGGDDGVTGALDEYGALGLRVGRMK